MRICNGVASLRKEYSMLRMLEEKVANQKDNIDYFCELIKDSKEAIRNTYRLEKEYANRPHWKTRSDGWDSRYMREEFDDVWTEEDIKEYKEEEWCHWYNPYGDGRDCTGVWFTTSIFVFPLSQCGKTIVYHFQACDV